MLKKCPYCNETHYESEDRIDCMEIVIKRQGMEHQALSKANEALSKVHEDLEKLYNREHLMLLWVVDTMRRRRAVGESPRLEDIVGGEKVLRGEDFYQKDDAKGS